MCSRSLVYGVKSSVAPKPNSKERPTLGVYFLDQYVFVPKLDFKQSFELPLVMEKQLMVGKICANKREKSWLVSLFTLEQWHATFLRWEWILTSFDWIDMKANNYEVVEAGEVITFRGIVQKSTSQAFFLTFCTLLGMASLALVLQIQFQNMSKWTH